MVNKQKILIVDDDENIAELISLYLTKECFDTTMVHNGEDALTAFDTCLLYTSHNNVPEELSVIGVIVFRKW